MLAVLWDTKEEMVDSIPQSHKKRKRNEKKENKSFPWLMISADEQILPTLENKMRYLLAHLACHNEPQIRI